jgi:hypothetical protein
MIGFGAWWRTGAKPMNGRVLRGIVRGKSIEVYEDVGFSDGEAVELVVRRVSPHDQRPGEGILRTEGALADDAEWDAIMDEIQRSRKQERRPQWEDA